MRPVGELEATKSTQYATTSWVPDYSYLISPITYKWGDMYPPYLKCTRQLLQSETAGEYKDMTYEQAHDEMQTFLETNNFKLNPIHQDKYVFFTNQMAKSNAQLAYDAIFAEMSNINKINPILYKDPIILAMIKRWPQILGYLNDQSLKTELTELTKGGKNIKKRYAKNTKGRRRQVSRKR